MENTTHAKNSFAAFSGPDSEILILGSLPGDKSLELNQYYGHPRNRFWTILAAVFGEPVPTGYEEKIKFLARNKIAVWDVARTANRKGSLDSAMKNEIPNDLDGFVRAHRNLKIIAFNGAKAAQLFGRHFKKLPHLKYLPLPSSSPANTIAFDAICNSWAALRDPAD
jgi:hypoxanthine-DNA glycosylase